MKIFGAGAARGGPGQPFPLGPGRGGAGRASLASTLLKVMNYTGSGIGLIIADYCPCILSWDPVQETWAEAGHLLRRLPGANHATAEVAVDEFAEFCVSSTSPLPFTILSMMLMTMLSVSWHA